MKNRERKTRYIEEFKEHVIALAGDSDKPIQVEAELGLSRGQISRWRRELQDAQLFSREDRDVEAENRRLRREVS
jgi:transposase-like protein